MSDKIEKAYDDASTFKREKTAKNYEGESWFKMLPDVNSPIECVMLLKSINEAIELMSKLQDSHYTGWIFNSSTFMDAWMQEFEPWFSKTEEKLLKLRAMMYGDNINWDELYRLMYNEALAHQVYWHRFYDEQSNKVSRQNEQLRDLLRENGITKDKFGKDI